MSPTIRVMRRLLFFMIFMVIVLILLAWSVPPSEREASYLMALRDKHALLGIPREPLVILAGGSGTAFGIDSEMLENELRSHLKQEGIPNSRMGNRVVNTGLHAGLGMEFMLNDLRDRLRPGDTILMIMEYSLWSKESGANAALGCVLVDVDPSAWQQLAIAEKSRMLRFVFPAIGRKTCDRLMQFRDQLLGREVIESGLQIYDRQFFNERGDLTSHWMQDSSVIQPTDRLNADQVDPRKIDFIATFVKSMNEKDVRVHLIPPTFQQRSFDNQLPFIEALSQHLKAASIGYAAEPVDYQVSDTMLFDTPYHLNRHGIDFRMKQLAKDLASYEE